jgi:hypothetical protein
MNKDRSIAVIAGVVFIIATVAQLIGVAIYSPILNAPDDLAKISTNESQVLLGTFLFFIAAIACTGIAVALYPVLRRYNDGLALGAVAFRTIEGALYVISTVCLLMLVSLSQESLKAGAPASAAFELQATLLKAARSWLGAAGVLTFALGGLMYYWVFYQSRLIPRWLSAWGVLAVILLMAAGVMVMLGLIEAMSTTQVVLALPIFLQEMVLAVWLIAKGFDSAAIAAPSAGGTSRWQASSGTAAGSAA